MTQGISNSLMWSESIKDGREGGTPPWDPPSPTPIYWDLEVTSGTRKSGRALNRQLQFSIWKNEKKARVDVCTGLCPLGFFVHCI